MEVLLSAPVYRAMMDDDIVHLSCHPEQPYHHKCLKQWLTQQATCPLDRRPINPIPPLVQLPMRQLSPVDERLRNWAMSIGLNR